MHRIIESPREDEYGTVIANVDIDELERVLGEPSPNSAKLLSIFDESANVLFSINREE